MLFWAVGAGALEITRLNSEAVAESSGAACPGGIMVFSGVLEVKGICLRKNAVIMPVTEYKGRSYTDIKLLSKILYSRIEACLSKGACKNKAAAEPVISIAEIKSLRSKTRVANAETVFDGELLVTAGVVRSSREPGEVWIAWPEIFTIKNAALKSKAEQLIKTAYSKTLKDPRTK